jgi:hypothetical protein
MKICGSRLIPAGLYAVLAMPMALGQAPSSPIQNALKAVPDTAVVELPEQVAPRPPKVVCSGDQLSISAVNSSLESILVMVRGCSGAKIEIPESAGHTRTFEELGPGPIRKVLDDLLSGTEFNYVIQSSDAFPQKVESILLSVRKKDSNSGNGSTSIDSPNTEIAMTPGRKKWLAMQKFDKPDPASLDSEPRLATDAPSSAIQEAQPVATAPDTAKPADATAEAAAPPTPPPSVADPPTSSDPAKVTEDRITSMQQMFDQRREMIQKQAAPAPATPSSTPN